MKYTLNYKGTMKGWSRIGTQFFDFSEHRLKLDSIIDTEIIPCAIFFEPDNIETGEKFEFFRVLLHTTNPNRESPPIFDFYKECDAFKFIKMLDDNFGHVGERAWEDEMIAPDVLAKKMILADERMEAHNQKLREEEEVKKVAALSPDDRKFEEAKKEAVRRNKLLQENADDQAQSGASPEDAG